MGNDFKKIVEERVSETREANERGLIDYFKESKYYNKEDIPRVEEKCLTGTCDRICENEVCSNPPPPAYFKIGRFTYIDENGELDVQSKHEQECSEITTKIFNQINVIENGYKSSSIYHEVNIDKARRGELIFDITPNMGKNPQDIFNFIYGKTFKKWAFIYRGKNTWIIGRTGRMLWILKQKNQKGR